MAAARKQSKRISRQTEATHEPLSGAPPAKRKPLTKPAQRKPKTKKPSKALKKALNRALARGSGAAATKGGVARPGVSRKPPGRSKKR